MTLNELANRVEAAGGADRELDRDIFAAVYPDRVPSPIVTSGYGWRQDSAGWWLATGEDARTPPNTIYPDRYTASIDAALTLVPEGMRFELTTTGFKPGATVCGNWLTGPHEGSYAATPALALTAAALRARAQETTK